MSKLRARLTYANVVATLALFLALTGGTAVASHLVVRSSDIVNNEVRTADVRNDNLSGGGLASGDIRPNALTSSDVRDDNLSGGGLAANDLRFGSVGSSEIQENSIVSDEQIGSFLRLAPDSPSGAEHGTLELADEFIQLNRSVPGVGNFDTGRISTRTGDIETEGNFKLDEGFLEAREEPNPGNPEANRARIYVRDNGGLTQLVVQFADGDIDILAQEAP